MAGFHQHVVVSTAFGIAYGTAAYWGLGIDWAPCAIAGGLTSLAGMLPDLDSPTGQPVREVMGFAAALVPVMLLKRMGGCIGMLQEAVTGGQIHLSHEAMIVVMAGCYLAIRFGGAWLLDLLTVHRGMFHSIPAAIIVALVAFLLCDAPSFTLRLFLAGGPFLGFLSHLLMDELWSVRVKGVQVGLKKSAGTAFKLFSSSIPATVATYTILLGLSYLVLQEPEVRTRIGPLKGTAPPLRIAAEWLEDLRR